MYQNGYLNGSPSKFSAKSAIYMAAGCQYIIATYTAAIPEQIQTIYTAAVCPHKIAIYTAAIQEPDIHCCQVYTKNCYLHGSRLRANRLYTLLPGVYKNRYLHGKRSRAKSVIYIAVACIQRLLFTRQPFKSHLFIIHCCRVYIHDIVIYTAAVEEPNPLCDYRSADQGLYFHIRKKLILSGRGSF